MKITTGLVWFRNDLRIIDNSSLQKAVAENDRVIAVYCFDPFLYRQDIFGFPKVGAYRTQFTIESVNELCQNLGTLNISLIVYQDTPCDVIPDIIKKYQVDSVYLQKEWTPEERSVSEKVKTKAQSYIHNWIETYDQFLFHPNDVPFERKTIPKVFTAFRKKCEKYAGVQDTIRVQKLAPDNKIPDVHCDIPGLENLGYTPIHFSKSSAFPFRGGENQAFSRMQSYFWDSHNLSTYKETRNGLIGTEYSSKFSPWLANGSISARTLYHQVKKYEEEIEANESTYWLVFELVWRDFFKYISLKHGNDIFKIQGILGKEYEWNRNEEAIHQWIEGKTEEPFVNANMLELKHTGWMSNRGRQNVASFFAKEKELDWRIGAAYFESQLIDYDVHSNYGNWMYVAGVGNDPRNRKFNIQSQAKRYDPEETYQKLWLVD